MKQAIITGGAGGLGQAIATKAASQGYRVGVLDLHDDAVRAVAGDIENAIPLIADVTEPDSIEAALDGFGEIPDLLVNNAGIVRFGLLEDQPLDTFRQVVDINLVGCFVVGQAVARRMLPRGSGAIVNITSIAGVEPTPGGGAYGATKAGLAALTKLMAIEWGPQGIRVNAVAPGFIDSGMSAPLYEDPVVRERRGGGVPLRRLGLAEDVAKAVMFLASEEAAYITAQEIIVDGGVTESGLAALPRD